MPSLSDKDRANLNAGLDAIRKIGVFTKDTANADQFFEDELRFDAVLMNFVVLGEVIGKVSLQTKERFPSIPWSKVKGFRNIIAHNYFGVDAEEVWQIIQNYLPSLRSQLEEILHVDHS